MKSTRRSVLKFGTAAGAAALGTGTVSGRDPDEFTPQDYQNALELRRQEDWGVDEWRDHIVDRGGTILVSDTTKTVNNWESDDVGPSINQLSSGDVSISITYVIYDGGGNEVDFDWTLDPPGYAESTLTENTQKPDDIAGIGWSDNDYVKDGDVYFDSYGSHLSSANSVTSAGAVVQWNDGGAGLDAAQNGESTASGFFGIPVAPRTGSDPDQRRIYVDYYHRWLAGRITGISFGTGGPSVGFSFETQYWVKEEDKYEKDVEQYIGGP